MSLPCWSARLGIVGLAVALTLVLAPGASAATEVGSDCEGNFFFNEFTVVGLSHGAGSPLPATAPSGGVVTSWRTSLAGTLITPFFASLKILRATGAPNQFGVVAASAAGSVGGGRTTFATRLPVQTGDRAGLAGAPITPVCVTKDKEDTSGFAEGPVPVGASPTLEVVPEIQVPIVAVIEADADGFGDETQDGCRQAAAYQMGCPRVVVRRVSQTGGSSVLVRVTSTLTAPIKVTGTVGLGKGRRVTLSAPPRSVAAGTVSSIRLKFPARLRSRLEDLSPRQSLRLKIAATATNVGENASSDGVTKTLHSVTSR